MEPEGGETRAGITLALPPLVLGEFPCSPPDLFDLISPDANVFHLRNWFVFGLVAGEEDTNLEPEEQVPSRGATHADARQVGGNMRPRTWALWSFDMGWATT